MERPVLLLLTSFEFCAALHLSIEMCTEYHSNHPPDPECETGSYTPDNSFFADLLCMEGCGLKNPSRRTQGFKRPKRCIPSSVDGTCIIPVCEKMLLTDAGNSCLSKYGGRLAVAEDADTNDLWLQAIWRHPKYVGATANQPSRFWLGAQVNSDGSAKRFFSITDPRTYTPFPSMLCRDNTLKDKKQLILVPPKLPLPNRNELDWPNVVPKMHY